MDLINILTANGLAIGFFDQKLASIIGNAPGSEGAKLLMQCTTLGRKRIEVCDWLFCLARTPATEVWKCFIEKHNVKPEEFVKIIHDGIEFSPSANMPVTNKVVKSNVSDNVMKMLAEAVRLVGKTGQTIDEIILTQAIFRTAEASLLKQLTIWLTGPDELEKFLSRLQVKMVIIDPLKADGTLDTSYFSQAGNNFIRRVCEDAASIRAKKVTTRNLLYSLLGNEVNCLSSVLNINGIDIKKDMYAPLIRELTNPGKKRASDFRLNSETLLPMVVHLLKEAQNVAHESGVVKVSENHIARAFIKLCPEEITRLLPPSKVLDMASVRRYMADSSADDEEERVIQKYTIKDIEHRIKDRIVGQEIAIETILPWLKRLRFGIPREGRPAGVFLFMGPTGTGKTQLAKELARFVFGDEDMMIFIEMGQFQTKESMSTFVGAPPGYVGYGEGLLTNGLRDKPECVVLFDEIEKANTQVFDTLLRFADEGLISDPAGPIRDGRKCIIVMTSNAGQGWLRNYFLENPKAINDPKEFSEQLFEAGMDELKAKGFRPEFLGRVDERITFMPFTENSCRGIVDRVLQKELNQLKELKGIDVEVPDEVKQFLAQIALQKSMEQGARGVPRAINYHIITPTINILTDCMEQKGYLPSKLVACTLGTGSATRVDIKPVS